MIKKLILIISRSTVRGRLYTPPETSTKGSGRITLRTGKVSCNGSTGKSVTQVAGRRVNQTELENTLGTETNGHAYKTHVSISRGMEMAVL